MQATLDGVNQFQKASGGERRRLVDLISFGENTSEGDLTTGRRNKTQWHTPRGDQPLNYTEFGDLASIVGQNWDLFEDYFQSQEWFRQLMNTLERSRNVIMHRGELSLEDVERVGAATRDYVRPVGA